MRWHQVEVQDAWLPPIIPICTAWGPQTHTSRCFSLTSLHSKLFIENLPRDPYMTCSSHMTRLSRHIHFPNENPRILSVSVMLSIKFILFFLLFSFWWRRCVNKIVFSLMPWKNTYPYTVILFIFTTTAVSVTAKHIQPKFWVGRMPLAQQLSRA